MAWHRTGDKPVPETMMMIQFIDTHICFTRSQCAGQTTCIVVPELISSTWFKPNPRFDSKCQYMFCNLSNTSTCLEVTRYNISWYMYYIEHCITVIKPNIDLELTKDISHLIFSDQLWGVYCEDLRELDHFITASHCTSYHQSSSPTPSSSALLPSWSYSWC